jgi:Rieske 2Fe-2S family protein
MTQASPAIDPLPPYMGLTQPEPTLPSSWYFDPAHHLREMADIWYREWLCVGRAEDLAAVGEFRSFAIGDQNILLLRGDSGLRAFHNTCRHRGSRLVFQERGRLASKVLTCPYHAWTYSLSGELLRTPYAVACPGFDKGGHGLFPVALENWRGFIFINLAPDPVPFAQAAAAAGQRLANWPLEGLVTGHRETLHLACNWKIFWENFLECYHCPGVHPGLSKLVPIYGRGIVGPHEDPEAERHKHDSDPRWRGGVRAGAETWSLDGKAQGPGFAGLSAAELKRGVTFQVWRPTGYMVGHVDYVRSVRVRPLTVVTTALDVDFLFDPETLATPGFDKDKIVAFALGVIQEDGAACEGNQAGLRALPFATGTLMPQEQGVKGFQDWVRASFPA